MRTLSDQDVRKALEGAWEAFGNCREILEKFGFVVPSCFMPLKHEMGELPQELDHDTVVRTAQRLSKREGVVTIVAASRFVHSTTHETGIALVADTYFCSGEVIRFIGTIENPGEPTRKVADISCSRIPAPVLGKPN